MIRTLFAVAAWTIVSLSSPALISAAKAQEGDSPYPTPDWSEYPLLMSQFGELCTMCVAYLQCVPGDAASEAPETYKLYYFQTKTFWGQIATIWDYFAKWFDPVTSEDRPATIYTFTSIANGKDALETTAYLDEEKGIIEIDGTTIDRNTAAWLDGNGTKIGDCRRLDIRESLALIEGTDTPKVQTQTGETS